MYLLISLAIVSLNLLVAVFTNLLVLKKKKIENNYFDAYLGLSVIVFVLLFIPALIIF